MKTSSVIFKAKKRAIPTTELSENFFQTIRCCFLLIILSYFCNTSHAQIANSVSMKSECIDRMLIDTTVNIPAIYEPVCACNGKTYPNKYVAQYQHGVTSWIPGECKTCELEIDVKGLDYDCIGAEICVEIINGFAPYRVYLRSRDDQFREVSGTRACFNELVPGTYQMIVKDRDHCEARVFFDVPETTRILNAEIKDVTCFDGNDGAIELTAPAAELNFEWRGPNGFTATTKNIDGLFAGIYKVKVSTKDGTCYTSGTFKVEQPRDLKLEFIHLGERCDDKAEGCLVVAGGTAPYKVWVFEGTNDLATLPNPMFNPNNVPEVEGLERTSVIEFDRSQGSNAEEYCARDIPAGIYYVLVVDANRCWEFIRIQILPASNLEIRGEVKNISCFNENDGAIEFQVSGGMPPYDVFWENENGQTGRIFRGLKAGVYKVTARDAKQCTTSKRFVIEEPRELNADFIITSERCEEGVDGCLLITGGTAPFRLWAFYSPNPNVIPAAPIFTTNGEVVVDSMNATTTFEFDGATDLRRRCASNIPAGVYYVLVVDANRCWEFIRVVIPNSSGISIKGAVKPVSCNGGNDGIIDLDIEGGLAPYTSFWTNEEGERGRTFDGLSAGKYLVTVFDANQCQATARFEIEEPRPLNARFEIITQRCDNGTDGCLFINGGTAPYRLWVFTSPVSNPMPPVPTFNANGEAEVDGMIRTEEVGFENNILSGDQICARNIPSGIYYVLIADANRCWTFKRIVIEDTPGLETLLDFDGYGEFACAEPLNGEGPFSFHWINLDNGNTLENSKDRNCIYDLRPGVYQVELVDANGCKASEIFFIESRNCYGGEAVVDPGEIRSGNNTTFALVNYKGTSIQWQFKTQETEWIDIPGATTDLYITPPIHTIHDKEIAVRAIVICEDGTTTLSRPAKLLVYGNPNLHDSQVSQHRNLFSNSNSYVNSNERVIDNELAMVYPTVSEGTAHIQLNRDTETTTIRVMDFNGHTYKTYTLSSFGKGESQQLDFSGVPSGMYLIKIDTPNAQCTRRVILQRK